MTQELYKKIDYWLKLNTDQVLAKFEKLPNAIIGNGGGLKRFVYVPGTRKDKVLLVAHADTVWGDGFDEIRTRLTNEDDVIVSNIPNRGIGADDRAGCAILWELRNLGHSLFIPDGEESGAIGSRFAMDHKHIAKAIQDHQFAIEFDRMSNSDLVYYRKGTRSFHGWLKNQMTGYEIASGSFTDICLLCDDICGANISIGYYDQHRYSEKLVLSEWQKSLDLVKNMLSLDKIPKFKLSGPSIKKVNKFSYSSKSMVDMFPKDKPKDIVPIKDTEYEESTVEEITIEGMIDEIYTCQDCIGTCLKIEVKAKGKCPFCEVVANV